MRLPALILTGVALAAQASCMQDDSVPLLETGSTEVVFATPSADGAANSGTVRFDVPRGTDSRLQVQLRGPLAGSEVTLMDPHGRVRATSADARYTPSAELNNPDRGDLVELPHILEPAGGTWRLAISPKPDRGTVFAAVTLAARYLLVLHTEGSVFSVGQPVFVQVRALEFGSISPDQPSTIEVRHLGADGVSEVPLRPQQQITGVASADPGAETLLGVWRPGQTGAHELRAAVRSDGNVVAEATRTVDVVEAPIRLIAVRPPGTADRGSVRVQVAVREAGQYTFSVTYTEDASGRRREVSGTWRLQAGETQVAVPTGTGVGSLQRLDVSRLNDGQLSLVVREDLSP